VRRLIVSLYVFALMLALPAAAFAQGSADSQNQGKPTGHDWTLTTIFFIALAIPALLGLLTLIDIARGKHTQRHN
jgi:Na+/melibiose symporter-like transporter